MKYIHYIAILTLLATIYILQPYPYHPDPSMVFIPTQCYKTKFFMYCKDLSIQKNLSLDPDTTFYMPWSHQLLLHQTWNIINLTRDKRSFDTIPLDGAKRSYLSDDYIINHIIWETSTLYQYDRQSNNYLAILSGDIHIITSIQTIWKQKQWLWSDLLGYHSNHLYDTVSQQIFFETYHTTNPIQVTKTVYQLETPLSPYFIIDNTVYYYDTPLESWSLITNMDNLWHIQDSTVISPYITNDEHVRYQDTYLWPTQWKLQSSEYIYWISSRLLAEDDTSYFIHERRYDKQEIWSIREAIEQYKQEVLD